MDISFDWLRVKSQRMVDRSILLRCGVLWKEPGISKKGIFGAVGLDFSVRPLEYSCFYGYNRWRGGIRVTETICLACMPWVFTKQKALPDRQVCELVDRYYGGWKQTDSYRKLKGTIRWGPYFRMRFDEAPDQRRLLLCDFSWDHSQPRSSMLEFAVFVRGITVPLGSCWWRWHGRLCFELFRG